MKKAALLFSIICSATLASAQLQPDGTEITTMPTVRDINGASYNTNSYLIAKKHIIFMFFSTRDANASWNYNNTHVLQDYYQAYGPNGTVAKDAMVFMNESDPTTTIADIQGTGSSTAGNWTAGNTFPISNDSIIDPTIGYFMDMSSPTPFVVLPAIIVVCKDFKMYQLSTALNTVQLLRDKVNQVCGAAVSVNEVLEADFSYQLAPNPATAGTALQLNLNRAKHISISVSNALGQTLYSQAAAPYAQGQHRFSLPAQDWSNGVYFVHLVADDRPVTIKLLVQH